MFTIFDELFLLSLHKEKCNLLPSISKNLDVGISGAILAELVVQAKLQVSRTGKFELVDSQPTGDEILDEAINLFQKSEKLHKSPYWVKSLSGEFHVDKKRLTKRLVNESILTQGEVEVTWTLPYLDSPNPSAPAWFVLKSRLRELVLTQGEAALCELAVLSIMKASKLLRLVFTRDERNIARRWIYCSLMDRAMKEPVAQSLQEIETTVEMLVENL